MYVYAVYIRAERRKLYLKGLGNCGTRTETIENDESSGKNEFGRYIDTKLRYPLHSFPPDDPSL